MDLAFQENEAAFRWQWLTTPKSDTSRRYIEYYTASNDFKLAYSVLAEKFSG
ncbi:MAG: hypothetical protein MZV70_17405 [Desulfobacterales bacterium]|nr:hypothetical protein [Desulfobacterales bacterium]